MAAQEPSAIVLVIEGPVSRAEVNRLVVRAMEQLARARGIPPAAAGPGAGGLVVCDVGALAMPDAALLDLLARLTLAARRQGLELRLRHASADLQSLLAFTGLSAVVRLEA